MNEEMNFHIIDGQEEYDYDAILQDYQNMELSVKEIQEKYGLTVGRWQNITKQWKQGSIPLRGRKNQRKRKYSESYSGAKNYSLDKRAGTYRVYKNIHGKNYYFGNYGTEEEAKQRVEYLKRNRWNGLL